MAFFFSFVMRVNCFFFFRLGIILFCLSLLIIIQNAQTICKSAKKPQLDVLYRCILFCFHLLDLITCIHFIFRPLIVKILIVFEYYNIDS